MTIRCSACDPDIGPLGRNARGEFIPRLQTVQGTAPYTSYKCNDCGHKWDHPHAEVKHR